jgi:DNA replication protein DnaC
MAAGFRVRYVLAVKLVNELVEAADERQPTKTIARYGRVDLLAIDELGYMGLDRRGAELLCRVLTERDGVQRLNAPPSPSPRGWPRRPRRPPWRSRSQMVRRTV